MKVSEREITRQMRRLARLLYLAPSKIKKKNTIKDSKKQAIGGFLAVKILSGRKSFIRKRVSQCPKSSAKKI